jgi:hypothetical protein
MSKGKKSKKDPNEGLPEGFVEAVSSMNTDEIRRKMADILLLDIAMHDFMEQDDKYQRAKEAFELLAAPYKEDFKSFKKQIAICKRILDDKNGGAISAKLEEDHLAAKEAKRTAGLRESTREEGDDAPPSRSRRPTARPPARSRRRRFTRLWSSSRTRHPGWC